MRRLAAVLLLAAVATPALAQRPVAERIPDRWNADQALVVGQLAGTWPLGVATMGGDGLDVGVAVKGGGGRPAGNGLFRGLVLFTRSAGEVTLSGAYASVGGMDRQLPIRRKLATKPGQVTVLGLMYFQKDPSTREGYRVVAFDNRDETMDYLRRTYPQLLAGHDDAEVVLAAGDYEPVEKLAALRTALAMTEARRAKREGQFFVAAPAGTIAEVKVAGESVQVLRFLPPVTYHEPMLNSWDAQGTLTFSSTTHRWRVVDGRVEALAAEAAGGKQVVGR